MTVAASEMLRDTSWPDAMDHAIGLGLQLDDVDECVAVDLISRIGRWEAQMAGIKMGLIRRVDEAGVAKKSGSTSTSSMRARHHHWVHSEDIHIRQRGSQTEFHINGIWQKNHRWRP